jgi:hypothetical protein
MAQESIFYRIKELPTNQYFSGGRTGVYTNDKGIRYDAMPPLTGALRYIASERRRAVELVGHFSESDPRADYWRTYAARLQPENFAVVRCREVVTELEAVAAVF